VDVARGSCFGLCLSPYQSHGTSLKALVFILAEQKRDYKGIFKIFFRNKKSFCRVGLETPPPIPPKVGIQPPPNLLCEDE
jgi:hypothetical protein